MSEPSEYIKRPDWVRRLNLFGPAVGANVVVPLEPRELIAQARASTGLEDFGGTSFIDTFERRIQAIDTEANINLLGRILCRAETLRVLQTRLRLQAEWTRTPAILDEKIDRPIFVVGAPRTGTTILLELLALDPNLRAPIAWEAHHPLPYGAAQDEPSRLRLAEAEQEFWADIQPELMTVHELRSDLPCECIHFMALDFASGYWAMHYDTPLFEAWAAAEPDVVAENYRGHRRFLQTLQHGRTPRRWLLKSPGHLAAMPALFAEYPDATIVHTHRDPMKFVGSAASTTAILKWMRCDAIDPAVHGQLALMGFAYMLNAVRTGRAEGTLPARQFVDSHYLDLISDPVRALRKIYSQANLDWPDGHDERIRTYLRDKPKGKFGKHEYDLSRYGLDDEIVRETYADYVDHYGVRPE